ncbi:MAG: hypothetical protein M1834_006767 [Cirrosporium novae-zelandiae]|nr:MAG: hypothetical protein M1834_006767 [Cirrosporium novae-zelandiae]
MILQRLTRPQLSLRAAFSSPSKRFSPTNFQKRGVFYVPQLQHEETFQKNGIPGLISPEGFSMAWTEYEGFMVHKLNLLISGTPDAQATDTKTLLIKYARQPDRAAYFNYASMAHNNHFFFSSLSPTPTAIPSSLLHDINTSFSSLDSFKATFQATASSMFGPGFVWLVSNPSRGLSILPTYLAGSPYPGAHYRQQPADLNTHLTNPELMVSNTVGSFGRTSAAGKADAKRPKGGIDVIPILCVNTWEHVWLRDFGVAGKDEFLKRWWDRIDWEKVAHKAGDVSSGSRILDGAKRGAFASSYR